MEVMRKGRDNRVKNQMLFSMIFDPIRKMSVFDLHIDSAFFR